MLIVRGGLLFESWLIRTRYTKIIIAITAKNANKAKYSEMPYKETFAIVLTKALTNPKMNNPHRGKLSI